jgi:FdhD protein
MDVVPLTACANDVNETRRAVVDTPVDKWTGLDARPTTDTLAVEEPLEIQILYGPPSGRARKSISVTMRTPGHDRELAAGFLLSEGVIADAADIERIIYANEDPAPGGSEWEPPNNLDNQPQRNIVVVELAPDVDVRLATLERNFYTTSSCGVCGKASLLALRAVCPPRRKNTFSIEAEVLYSLPARLREGQCVFERTGGLHGAGLFDASGRLLAMREDVGRHNAVDKLLGAEFLEDRTPLHDFVLLLSGRASFELLEKAAMSGVSMVGAIGAPSSMAVAVAREFDVILVGFLRDGHMNVYHGADHILRRKVLQEEV